MKNDLSRIKKKLKFERTLVLVKPDGLQRGLVGKVISRFEQKGLKLVAVKMVHVNDVLLEFHYQDHKNKPFFKSLAKFMKSSPVIAMVWEGVEAIEAVRLIAGTTNARKALAGSIRGDFGMGLTANIVHASDSVDAASKEIALFFNTNELFDYDKTEYLHIYLCEV